MKKSDTEETLPTELTQEVIEEEFQEQANALPEGYNVTVVRNLPEWEENGYKSSPDGNDGGIEKDFGSDGSLSFSNRFSRKGSVDVCFSESDRSSQASEASVTAAPQNHQRTVVSRRQVQQEESSSCCIIL